MVKARRVKITRSRPVCRTKHTIKGRKYKYPTTEEGKKKLFETARRYFRKLRDNPDMPKHKLHYKYHYAYYGSRPLQRKRKAIHMRHRYKLEQEGRVKRHDGTEVDHMRRKTLDYSSIVIRKNRCTHNKAHGRACRDPTYKPTSARPKF